MKLRSMILATLALVQCNNAWVLTTENLQKAVSVASISAVMAVAPMSVNAVVDFSGSYSDPNHPNCLRVIEVPKDNSKNGVAAISGTDGTPGCPPDGSGKTWQLQGKITGDEIFIDFSPKGGPKDLVGKWEDSPSGIRFPDGNKWTKK